MDRRLPVVVGDGDDADADAAADDDAADAAGDDDDAAAAAAFGPSRRGMRERWVVRVVGEEEASEEGPTTETVGRWEPSDGSRRETAVARANGG